MNDELTELYLLRTRFKENSERWLAARAWLSGETFSPTTLAEGLGINRPNASTALRVLKELGLVFDTHADPASAAGRLYTLIEPNAGRSTADTARHFHEAWVDPTSVLVETADGQRFELTLDGKGEPTVKRKRKSTK